MSAVVARLVRPFRSRKVRVALATVLAAVAARCGLQLSADVIHTIVAVGVAVILGIAHEDAAAKASAPPAQPRGE